MRTVVYEFVTLVVLTTTMCGLAQAAERASLVVDADTGAVLHANNANLPSFPASLTKLMTSYLLLDAVTYGRLTFTQELEVSDAARRQPPKRLGLKRGAKMTVEDALLATLVYSANDAAVVAAEAVASSEKAFVAMMNAKAEELGMFQTHFSNSTGLPDRGQITTPRDLAVLTRSLLHDFDHDELISRRAFRYKGRRLRSSSRFLREYDGLEVGKTGFTCKAGYNLLASVTRHGRRLIGITLGNPSAKERDRGLARLLESASLVGAGEELEFDVDEIWQATDQGADELVNNRVLARSCLG